MIEILNVINERERKEIMSYSKSIDLEVTDSMNDIETMVEGNALSSFASSTSASSASCPASSASSFTTASSYG